MFTKSHLTKGLVTLSLLSHHVAWAQPTSKVERPPQFVMFAFDGSYNNDVWQYSRDFSKRQKTFGIDNRFTFFINAVYLLSSDNKTVYMAPGGNKGSNIGWGDNKTDISNRIDQMNDAYTEGHELGSHTVGHFDGRKFSDSDWTSEFSQFNQILDNVFSLNKIQSTSKQSRGLLFQKDIIGFRAPLLGTNKALYTTLSKFGFKYDTSQVDTETYWPKKNDYGTWNFPLAEIKEPGGARKWVSMDYNFCVRDSSRILSEDPDVMDLKVWSEKKKKAVKANGAKDCLKEVNPEEKEAVKANMLSLYRSYFNKNYYGNRAPVNIGHHFSRWMSGAYFEAYFEFANEVCSKPEVRCGTYTDLMKFLDSKSPDEIEAYRKGNFDRVPRPKAMTLARHWDLNVTMSLVKDSMKFSLTGVDAKRAGLKKKVSVSGSTFKIENELKLADIREVVKSGETAFVRLAVFDRLGKEVSTATYQIDNVGEKNESVNTENIESRWMEGHLPGAHADEVDFTQGH